MSFEFSNIVEYQIEITSYCNAACPQCPRNINGHGINKYMPLTHLSYEVIDKTFTVEICKNLRQVFFCGSYGDPIMHPRFLDILQNLRDKNPTLWLYIHTNGGVHNKEYWNKLAKILNGFGQIDFGIDGLEDTLGIYRQNVKFKKVIENAKSFIDAGGKAQWNFIVFKHNQHQIIQVKNLAKELGFINVLVRNTGRFFNHQTLSEMTKWPIHNGNFLSPPDDKIYRNRSMLNLPKLKEKYGDLYNYFDKTPITCDAMYGKKVAINAEGLVLPCNFFNHNLYDARFFNRDILPSSNDLSFVDGKNQVATIVEQFGKDELNINHKTLSEIFNNPFWKYVENSWTKNLKNGRIFECAMTCGSELTKVWDQGSNDK